MVTRFNPKDRITSIKAISFDGDGTLWDFEKVMRHSLHHVIRELQKIDVHTANKLTVEKMIEVRNRVAAELKGKVTNLEKVRFEAFRQALKEIDRPNDELAVYLNEVYLKHRFEDIELFDDVLPALNTLGEKYTLGLLSNGNNYPESCGLKDIFQFVVLSQDHGIEKPDPKLFLIALNEAGCSRQELLHVGDSLQDDVVGAANAGIKCVWLNRGQMKRKTGFSIEYEVSSLLELLEIL
ncbi:MAG: HAD family hydrolase [Promethearchaeota archaeon]